MQPFNACVTTVEFVSHHSLLQCPVLLLADAKWDDWRQSWDGADGESESHAWNGSHHAEPAAASKHARYLHITRVSHALSCTPSQQACWQRWTTVVHGTEKVNSSMGELVVCLVQQLQQRAPFELGCFSTESRLCCSALHAIV